MLCAAKQDMLADSCLTADSLISDMKRAEFEEYLKRGPILLDGAFGTLLHSKGVPIDQSFDAINLSNPGVVASIHRDYIEAGADIIETNTFGANRFNLGRS